MAVLKFQSGGGLPPLASYYVPVQTTQAKTTPPVVGELARLAQSVSVSASTSTTTKSGKGNGVDLEDTLQLLKDANGLDNDTELVLNTIQQNTTMAQVMGTDTTGLINTYYQNLNLVNKLKQSNELYKKANAHAEENESLGEYALDMSGNVWVKNAKGQIGTVSIAQYKANEDSLRIMTNEELLYERQFNPKLTFQNQMLASVESSTSMKEIYSVIKGAMEDVKSSSKTLEGANADTMKAMMGFDLIQKNGLGEEENANKYINESNAEQVQAAISFATNALTNKQKALLYLKSGGTDEGFNKALMSLIASKTQAKTTVGWRELSEKERAAKRAGSGGNGALSDINLTAPVKAMNGIGDPEEFKFNVGGTNTISAQGVRVNFTNSSSGNMSAGSTLQDLSKSSLFSILDTDTIQIGGAVIKNTSGIMAKIVVGNNYGYSMDLPVDGSGNVDMSLLEKKDQIDKKLRRNGTPTREQQAQAYGDLPLQWDESKKAWKWTGATGKFFATNVMVDKDAVDNAVPEARRKYIGLASYDEVASYADSVNKGKKKDDEKFEPAKEGFFWDDDINVYKGTAFIKITKDSTSAYAGNGNKNLIAASDADEVREASAVANKYESAGGLDDAE